MPFKSLAGLKKMGSLDAEVVALAPYQPGSVCAAITTDPVRVALYQFAGGPAKIQNVSLDGCSEGALIDETVAVLKSGDEIWGVLDLQHKPKIDPVARSVRALVANPAGKSALVLGWGSEASELKLEGHEVVAREFTMRGNVRSASIDGASCHVVADDGEAGGRFREHPGSTPESGTQLRCDLPLAAKKMTRVAGGAQLAALTRKGGSEVCVVRKVGAAALEAKLLGIEAPVVDVAVLETTLFVACADGVVRVYGADVLHRTGDGGQAVATFALSLGADGPLTALATSARGGNRLWIGTREGEVFRCDAVKGTVGL